MSYILDALKKSEKERQRGSLPDMLTVQDIVAEKPPKRISWVYLLAAVLLLNAGGLVWWLGFSHTNKTKVQPLKTENSSPLSANESDQKVPGMVKQTADPEQPFVSGLRPADRNTASATGNLETTTTVRDQNLRKVLPEVQVSPVSVNNPVRPSEPAPAKSEQAAGTVRIPTVPAGGLLEAPAENKLYKLQELPSYIRKDLPAFSVTALLYSSNPDSRMVRINDQMMHEGQDLATGLILDEITRDGIILKYQKFRFYVGAK